MESVHNPLHIIWVCSSFLGAWVQKRQIGSDRLILIVTQRQLKRVFFFYQASLWPFHLSHLTFTSCEVPPSHVCALPISPQECQTIEMSLWKAVKVYPMSLLFLLSCCLKDLKPIPVSEVKQVVQEPVTCPSESMHWQRMELPNTHSLWKFVF